MLRADTPPRLRLIRALIDCSDAGLLLLWSGRRRLAGEAARVKRAAGLPLRDLRREAEVHRHAQRLSQRLGLPAAKAETICGLLIEDACRMQRAFDDALPRRQTKTLPEPTMTPTPTPAIPRLPALPAPLTTRDDDTAAADRVERAAGADRWLRLLPPPSRLAPLLRRVPGHWHTGLLRPLLQQALAQPLSDQRFDVLRGRRIGIRVTDLGLGWTVSIDVDALQMTPGTDAAESVVHGSATDLLLLASRLQDADTLFFKRQLRLTGDVELGLTARNLLDQLPFEQLPLALRILLHRAARLAQSARQAYRSRV